MNSNTTIQNKIYLLLLLCGLLCTMAAFGQETISNNSSNSTYHNQLFFNRFLINPTFSLVRENKSYLNLLHRNQYATFEDNRQNYYLGFSNQLNDHTAVGVGIYSQWSGVIQEFGFNANYATSVQLGSDSKLTFGTTVTYFNQGLDKNRVVATENDQQIMEAKKESKLAIQPGITLSLGKFDFGLYAENMFQFNQTTNEFSTTLNDKSLKASLQYTHTFMATRGLFANARLMPLLQMGRKADNSLSYIGAILLDLPNYGWLQTALDDEYGLSMGFGFNINKKMSLGYLLEKDFIQDQADFGWNHELSLAYTFENYSAGSRNYVGDSDDQKIDGIIRNYEEQILKLVADKNNAAKKNQEAIDPNTMAYENRMILDELILRQDSMEIARNEQFDQRFEALVRILQKHIEQDGNSNKPELVRDQNSIMVAAVEEKAPKIINKAEEKGYVKLPIKVLDQSDIVGVNTGYYVIANVYKEKKYLNAFMKSLKDQGLNAKQFYNKENGLYYVYLADYNFKEDAEVAYTSNLDGKYRDEKWIMQVDNPAATVANTYEDQDAFINRND
ncbi:MAG: type IX secretion system membrane protein PorP/SprF [Flavobacteriales bacterium]|nr:MAG: type IX secretion system membrane protein PorP/SprF [Flavobacteriales bacterium]